MLRKFMLATAGACACALLAVAPGPAQAAGTHLGSALRAIPAESHVIAVQERRRAAPPRRIERRAVRPPPRMERRAVRPPARVERRYVRPGPGWRWTRDRRFRYYGTFFAVPFGTALYGSHYCYDWRWGARGLGYYWNYGRCPV